MHELKISKDEINGIWDTTEEIISKLEGIAVKSI